MPFACHPLREFVIDRLSPQLWLKPILRSANVPLSQNQDQYAFTYFMPDSLT